MVLMNDIPAVSVGIVQLNYVGLQRAEDVFYDLELCGAGCGGLLQAFSPSRYRTVYDRIAIRTV